MSWVETAEAHIEEMAWRVQNFASPHNVSLNIDCFVFRGEGMQEGGELASFLWAEDDSFNVGATGIQGSQHLRAMVECAAQPLRRIMQEQSPFLGHDGLSPLLVLSIPDLEN